MSTGRWFELAAYRDPQSGGGGEEVEEVEKDLKKLLRRKEGPIWASPRSEVAHGVEEHDGGRVVHHALPDYNPEV